MRELKRSTEEGVSSRPRRTGGPHISLERRLHPRLPAVDYRIWVGGWASARDFVTIAARVVNLSRGGSLILTNVPFAVGDDVWLRLGSPAYDGCVRAEVLDATPTSEGDHLVRLCFHEQCPDVFYEVVTIGLAFGDGEHGKASQGA
ncbi:PilZ domain-containing protein [Paludisphaera rhizosphaerae]|uniref:PilZ domain-containing protein n=1 Tax=Paludisphaera rhizosphaerae TaxID=2711216 RepID=UPI0013EAEF80|nr:PilZ domain-containing protein [Paludisphaera rhizosphaerae]